MEEVNALREGKRCVHTAPLGVLLSELRGVPARPTVPWRRCWLTRARAFLSAHRRFAASRNDPDVSLSMSSKDRGPLFLAGETRGEALREGACFSRCGVPDYRMESLEGVDAELLLLPVGDSGAAGDARPRQGEGRGLGDPRKEDAVFEQLPHFCASASIGDH